MERCDVMLGANTKKDRPLLNGLFINRGMLIC